MYCGFGGQGILVLMFEYGVLRTDIDMQSTEYVVVKDISPCDLY